MALVHNDADPFMTELRKCAFAAIKVSLMLKKWEVYLDSDFEKNLEVK